MRMMRCLAAVAALCGAISHTLESGTAVAADLDRPYAGKARVHHRAHHPRHAYVLREDPYAYQYEPRGYYPYYRADYWRPAGYVVHRSRVHYNVWNTRHPRFRFYKSWGYPVRYWPHKEWHAYHHGHHRPWHW